MSEEPISHIARGRLPWRSPDDDVTECGKRVNEFKSVISAEAAQALWKKHGETRARFLLCVTCVDTANRYSTNGAALTWETDPDGLLERYLSRSIWRRTNEGRLSKELRALAAVALAHRDEFDVYLDGLESAPSMADARAAKRRRETTR